MLSYTMQNVLSDAHIFLFVYYFWSPHIYALTLSVNKPSIGSPI